jgi:hypothetical protein
MSAKRQRTTFGMHHLTVVPTNAAASSRDEDETGDETGTSTDAA